jgi:acetyltransferase-like isoleucine patch superfamily enzyme
MSDRFFSPYLARLRAAEARGLLKGLIPSVFWSYRLRRRYRKLFPEAFVSSGAIVALNAKIGKGCIVRRGCDISASTALGQCTTLSDDCLLRGAGRIEVGPFCSVGPQVVMISENHAFDRLANYPFALYCGLSGTDHDFVPAEISIGADVWIGQRAIILAGARIGTGCVVGAGSVVTRGDYEPFTVLAGVPARPIRKRLDEASRQELLKSEWWLAPAERVLSDWAPVLRQSHWKENSPTQRG